MKRFFIALVAVFAMGSMASAQDSFDMQGAEDNGMAVSAMQNEFSKFSKSDIVKDMTIADIDLSQLKDISFMDENGAIATVSLDAAAGGNRVAASLLAIFLGDFGIHHFYTGDTKEGILHLVFCWTVIPGIIGFIEGIMWLVDEGSFPSPLIKL